MEDDGFRLVVRKRNSKKKREVCLSEYLDLFSEISVKQIDIVMQYALTKMQNSLFCKYVVNLISGILSRKPNSCRIKQIRAIGVGHFCQKGSQDYGSHQLALLLLLKEHFKCEVTFQEPISTDNEKVWLRSQGIHFLQPTNLEECSASLDSSCFTFFYMPHCDIPFYNSVIYAHRCKKILSNIIILGNNLVSFEFNSKFKHELASLLTYREVCICVPLPKYEENPFAFSNTAVHYLDKEFPKIPEAKPQYDFYKVINAYRISSKGNEIIAQTSKM